MGDEVVIGIDGGGTSTRVIISDLHGNQLAYAEGGCASKYKDKNASLHVKSTIENALSQAKRQTTDAVMLVAGIASYESRADDDWIVSFTDLPGLACPKKHLNDSDVAHAGALNNRPGIIAIAGTGTTVMGINEAGNRIRNLDFHQYAYSAARHLSYEAVYEVLAGHRDESNKQLISQMLQYWQMNSLEQLQQLASNGFENDSMERNRKFGQFAAYVTDAAASGSSVALRVCDRACEQIRLGIELVGSNFVGNHIDVAFIGSVIRSSYMSQKVTALLKANPSKHYQIIVPKLSPAEGAVLLALEELKKT